jgi:hypothetical protein
MAPPIPSPAAPRAVLLLTAAALLLVARAQSPSATLAPPPASASSSSPSSSSPLLLWLRPEALGDGSRAGCSGAIAVWPNAAPRAAAVLLGYDARVPAPQAPPSRLFDNATGACVSRFTAAAGTALAVPTLDLTAPSQSYTVTIVARMWAMDGANRQRVISGAEPLGRDWFMGWHNSRSDLAFYNGGWLGGVTTSPVEAWGTREWIMYTLTRDGSSGGASVLYKNGNMAITGSLSGGPPGILLGGGYRYNFNQAQQLAELSDCDVAEVLVHDGVLSASERTRLEGDLAAKYRMVHRLPAGHPAYAVPLPAPAPTAMPVPRVWLRPEGGLNNASGTVAVWANSGTGGAGLNGLFAGSGGSNAPVVTRARFAKRVAGEAEFSALRFTAAQCSRLYVPIDLHGDAQSSTIVAVSRMWGATRGRVVTSDYGNWLMGWVGCCGDPMDVFYTEDGKSWVYFRGPPVRPEFGAYSWQLHAMTRRGTNGSVTSEVAVYSNGVELARQPSRGGFFYPTLGGWRSCGESSDSDVAELLIWDYELSPDQLAAVTSYLQARYVIGGNEPLAQPSPSTTASGSPSPGASPTATATVTATALRCAIDESFVDGSLPLSWTASPPSLVTVLTSAPPRGTGATIYDPLSTGSPFAHLRSGAGVGEYTTLSVDVTTEASSVSVSADVQFDAGNELPFNDDAFVAVTPVGQQQQQAGRVNVCGVARRVGDSAALACPAGQTILSFPFVSYGNPTLAGCGAGHYAYGACHANSSLSAAASACIGQASCAVPLTAAAAVACTQPVTNPPVLAIVAECSLSAAGGSLFSRNVATVGAYAQSGWTRVSTTLSTPGTYRLTFGVRSVGANDLARASALAVDNVLACLQPLSTASSSPRPATTSPVPTPDAAIVADVVQVSYLSAGPIHTCGVTLRNRLLCWGGNVRWWDGVSSATEGQATVPPELTFANVSTVSAGDVHTCAVLSDGRVHCFGGNWRGQSSVPAALFEGRVQAVSVAAGHDFSCAITTVGETQCWGNIGSPPAVLFRGTVAVAAGFSAACAITAYRTVVCWGTIAQPPAGVASVQFIAMSGYPLVEACAVMPSGVVCWGAVAFASDAAASTVAILSSSEFRMLGAGGLVTDAGGGSVTSRRVAIACGRQHCCYQFKDNATLSCVGDNTYGQLAPPLQQPFATPLPRFYPPVIGGAAGAGESGPCSSEIGASAASPALDCAEYDSRACDRTEGVRWITAQNGSAYQAVCFEGFALAMKLSPGGTVFRYDSGYWSNSILLNANPTAIGAARDAKLAPFVNQWLRAVRVRNRAANTSITVGVALAESLASLFKTLNDTELSGGSLQRAAWLSIAPGVCLQEHCNRAGFNMRVLSGHAAGNARLGFVMNEQNDCNSPDVAIFIGSANGYNVQIWCSSPSLELYVRGTLPSATSPTPTPSLTASLTPGASASSTATVIASAPSTPTPSVSPPASPSRSVSPPGSGTPTGTLTLRASASATATSSLTASATRSPSGTPYCAVGEYQYFPGYDVDGNVTLGVAVVASERDCARACCDVPACDGYSYSINTAAVTAANCFYVAHVSGIVRNRLLNGGVRTRVL